MAQVARSQAESTGAAQGRVEKPGRLRPPRLGSYDHDGGEDAVVYLGEPIHTRAVLQNAEAFWRHLRGAGVSSPRAPLAES